jgi:predicted permease
VRVYRALLFLFPHAFRERFARDMGEVFEDRWRKARRTGTAATIRLAAVTCVDLVAQATAERCSGRGSRPHPPRARGDVFMLTLIQDVRFALRTFRRHPAFTAIALATIAIGVGANVAIFSVVRPLLLDRLPFADPDRVVQVYQNTRKDPTLRIVVSPAIYDAWESQHVFAAVTAFRNTTMTLSNAGDPTRETVTQAMPSLFQVFGVTPALGRMYTAEEASTREPIVVISHALWRERFNADAEIIGRSIRLQGRAYKILGVAPPGFDAPSQTAIWVPYALTAAERTVRDSYFLGVAARLAPSQTVASAMATASGIVAQLNAGTRAEALGRGAYVLSWKDSVVGSVRNGLWMLQGVALLVLLIACANLANLLLAHAAGRSRELSVRVSLGAGRARLVRQLMTEGLVLSLIGGAIGMSIAMVSVPALVDLAPSWMPQINTVAVRWPGLAAALALTVSTGVAFSVTPALFAARGGLRAAESRRSTATPGQRWTRGALIATQAALALVLISGAALVIRSFVKITALPVGFDSTRVLTAQMALPETRYDTVEKQRRFYLDLIDGLGQEPGVVSATASTALPFTYFESATSFTVLGHADVTSVLAPFRMVTPDYFRTLGVPIIAGRNLAATDTDGTPLVAVVSEQFLRTHAALGNVIGVQLIRPISNSVAGGAAEQAPPRPITIVGVVGDTKQRKRDAPPQGELYFPLAQTGHAMMTLAIRTSGRPMALAPTLRARVNAIDPELPLADVRPLAEWLGASEAERRFYSVLLGLFASLAVTLAAAGIYGVTSYFVGLRMREVGIRLALGASAGRVRSLIIRQGMAPVILGMIVGLGATLMTSKVLQDQLFELGPRDPGMLALAASLLLIAGLIACWLPSRRTAEADPAIALRGD